MTGRGVPENCGIRETAAADHAKTFAGSVHGNVYFGDSSRFGADPCGSGDLPLRPARLASVFPFTRNRRFTGRTTELELLERKLFVDRDCDRIALVGLGGIGKTQIAQSLALAVKEKRPEYSIFWLSALSLETFEQGCGDIVRRLRLRDRNGVGEREDVKELVRQRLSEETEGKWLLIVDNADDDDLVCGIRHSEGIVDHLPVNENGLTLFTTRSLSVAQALVGNDVIEVEKLGETDATCFLTRSLHSGLLTTDEDLRKLLSELDYLPLAIAQAAAYMNTKKTSVTEYLRLLRNTEQDLLQAMSVELRDNTRQRGAANAAATTWIVSFEQISAQDPAAAKLLAFMACIQWKAIPRSMLPSAESEVQTNSAIGTLLAFSFITRRADTDLYDMHRLVHLATKIWLRQHERLAAEQTAAVEHLSEIRMDTADQISAARSAMCVKVGRCLRTEWRFAPAVDWIEDANRWASTLTKDHLSRLAVEVALAAAYDDADQARKATDLLSRILTTEPPLPPEASQIMSDARWVHEAMVYRETRPLVPEISILENVAAVDQGDLTEADGRRLDAHYELSRIHQSRGEHVQAIRVLEHAVELQVLRLSTASSTVRPTIASTIDLLERVFIADVGTPSSIHYSLLSDLDQLAGAYLRAPERVQDGAALAERLVAIWTALATSEGQFELLDAQLRLARSYRALNEPGKAVDLMEPVVAVGLSIVSEDDDWILDAMCELASTYLAIPPKFDEGIALLEAVVGIKERTQAPASRSCLSTKYELAMAYLDLDRTPEKAVALLENIVAITVCARADGDLLDLDFDGLQALLRAYIATGQHEKAAEMWALHPDMTETI